MPDITGVDVASFQGTPGQWATLPGAKDIAWAAVKFSEVSGQFGAYENPDAKADWDWLWEKKKGRVAYLFAHPSVSVADTIATFRSMTERLGFEPGDGVCVDLEPESGLATPDGLSPAVVASWMRELMAELAKIYGRRPILYCDKNTIWTGCCEGLENYHLWLADPSDPPGLPAVPRPFTDWFAQQVNLDGAIDRDVAHFSSLGAMQASMGAPQYKDVEAVHVTTGEESLVSLSWLVKTTISEMLVLTFRASPSGEPVKGLADYIDHGDLKANLAKGISIRYMEKVRA